MTRFEGKRERGSKSAIEKRRVKKEGKVYILSPSDKRRAQTGKRLIYITRVGFFLPHSY